MVRRLFFRILIIGLAILILISLGTAFASSIDVPDSNIGFLTFPVTANDLKPPDCISLNLSNVVAGSGTITGTDGNDLILGSAGSDTINGMGGDDCILAGAGDDSFDGGADNDICIGGAGTDSFANCEVTIQ